MNIQPIDALYFNPKKVELSDVITPPYDVIPPTEEKRLCDKSIYNFAHIIMPREESEPYAGALKRLQSWVGNEILIRSIGPHYYVYQQNFDVDGKRHSRTTFLCAVRLQDFATGKVRPHEKTHGTAQSDRLRILKKTGCNLSSIFTVVQDPDGIMTQNYERWVFHTPLLSAKTDDGIEHNVWEVRPEDATQVVQFLEEKPIYIVDGHHRYASALDYAREKKTEGTEDPTGYMFFAIANAHDPALLVYPTHRVVKQVGKPELANAEKIDEFVSLSPFNRENVESFVSDPHNQPNFLIDFGDKIYMAEPKNPEASPADPVEAVNRLSVTWSDRYLLREKLGVGEQDRSKSIEYRHDWREVLDTKDALFKIILPSMSVNDIIRVSDDKGFMPQKSTYFYPKLAAGLVLRQVENKLT